MQSFLVWSGKGLLCVSLLYEIGLEKVVGAHLDALLPIAVGIAFQLDDEVLHTCSLSIVEDGIEANHTALTKFEVILDVEERKPAGILPEVLDRICAAHASPVHVHLEEDVLRIGVLEHEVVDHLVLDLVELV